MGGISRPPLATYDQFSQLCSQLEVIFGRGSHSDRQRAGSLASGAPPAPRFAGRARRSLQGIPGSSISRTPLRANSPARRLLLARIDTSRVDLASSVSQQAGCHFSPAHRLAGGLSRFDGPPVSQTSRTSASFPASSTARRRTLSCQRCVGTSWPPFFFNQPDAYISPARRPCRVDACRIGTTHLMSSGPQLGPLRRHFPPAQRSPADSHADGVASALVNMRPRSPTRRTPLLASVPGCQLTSSLARRRALLFVALCSCHHTSLQAVSTGIEPYTNHCVHWYPTVRKCSCVTDSLTRHGSLLLLCGVSSAACVALRLLAGNAARSPSQCFGPESPPRLPPASSLLLCTCLLYVVCTSPLRAPYEPPLRSNFTEGRIAAPLCCLD